MSPRWPSRIRQPMIASQGSGVGSLPKLQGHVVAQLHASMTSPRMRHEVSTAMTHLLVQHGMDCCRDRAGFQASPIARRLPARSCAVARCASRPTDVRHRYSGSARRRLTGRLEPKLLVRENVLARSGDVERHLATRHDMPEFTFASGADDRRVASRTGGRKPPRRAQLTRGARPRRSAEGPGSGVSRPGSGSLVDGKILRKTRFWAVPRPRPCPQVIDSTKYLSPNSLRRRTGK